MSNPILLVGNRDTFTFSEIWKNYNAFKTDYDGQIAGFTENATPVLATSLQTIFYLLYASYGNNPIANSDVGQFKMKIVSTIYAYGPTWL